MDSTVLHKVVCLLLVQKYQHSSLTFDDNHGLGALPLLELGVDKFDHVKVECIEGLWSVECDDALVPHLLQNGLWAFCRRHPLAA